MITMVILLLPNKNEGNNFFSRDPFSQSNKPGEDTRPDYKITFPDDHFEHINFDIEWWYLTANLESENGEEFGLQWTLFRFRNPQASPNNKWSNNQIYMAHASIHNRHKHFFTEKYARGNVGNAGNFADPFRLSIDDWLWINSDYKNALFPASLSFSATSSDKHTVSAKLAMNQSGPFILHGDNGYSIKSSNGRHASHYYSAPFIDMQGSFKITNNITGETYSVLVNGKAWYDHEWTSQLLNEQTEGWDWMSLHLENGDKLMAFRMRLNNEPDYVTGTYIKANGNKITLSPDQISLTPTGFSKVMGKSLPLSWELSIKSLGIRLEVQSVKDDQWNNATIPYYEGMVSVKGSQSGRGFIELTGYN